MRGAVADASRVRGPAVARSFEFPRRARRNRSTARTTMPRSGLPPLVVAAASANMDLSVLAPCLEVLRRACPAAAAESGCAALSAPEQPPAAAAALALGDALLHPGLAFGLLKGGVVAADDLLALSDEEIWGLRRECAQHGMLCFRGVADMTAEKFGNFMARWGRIVYDFDATVDGSLEPSAPAAAAPVIFGNGGDGQHLYADTAWHFDGEDLPWLHSFTTLFCVRPPFAGHTTNFAATNCAAGHMPPGSIPPPPIVPLLPSFAQQRA